MSHESLKYVSSDKLDELVNDIPANRVKYQSAGFDDVELANGWSIEAQSVKVNTRLLSQLDGTKRTADNDIENSLKLYAALDGMTPALACEERVWVRLSHIECMQYTRDRWLSGKEDEELDKAVRLHAFARGRTGVRDDNALGRLWWSSHIAFLANPENPEEALRLLLKALTIRMSFVERTNSASRIPLAQGIVRVMKRDGWLVETANNCRNFQDFMIALNRDGGGIAFERMTEREVDKAMDSALIHAKKVDHSRPKAVTHI